MDDANIKYLEAKISGLTTLINAQFINVHECLDDIKVQTKKTNLDVDRLQIDMVKLKLSDADHFLKCPNIEKIEKINTDLNEYRFFKKYPKIALFVLVIGVILIIFNVFDIYKQINLASSLPGDIKNNAAFYNHLIHIVDSLKLKP